MALTVEELVAGLNVEIRGDRTFRVEGAQSIDKAGPGDITFVSDATNLRKLKQGRAGAAIVNKSLAGSLGETLKQSAIILVDDAHMAFVKVLERMRPRRPRSQTGVSKQAYVSPSAKIGENTNVAPGATVGDDATIGRNCDIHPGVCIGSGCRIGDNVTIYPNVVLYADVSLGNRVIVHASAVLGADGFGYHLANGRHQKIPHFGTVRIEDDVEIGAGTTIDRAMVGETVIGEGTKLDNLVHIAHNCEIGKHNIFASQVGFAGSVTTGEYVVCAGQVGVADHVRLGDHCMLGSKSGVHKDLPGGRFLGAPAHPAEETVKSLMALRKLPDLRERVQTLDDRVAALSAKLEAENASRTSREAA